MFWKRAALGLIAACLVSGVASAALAIREEVVEEDLIARLQHGGYVIYLRHAQRYGGPRDGFEADSSPAAFADCTHQRNLTPYGIGQAALLGEDLRRAGVKVGSVLSHPECRTRDTATLVFGSANADMRMLDLGFIRRQLAAAPPPGTNNFMVDGEYPLRQIVGFQLEPAEMAIFQPDGHGGTRFIGRLKVEDWFDD